MQRESWSCLLCDWSTEKQLCAWIMLLAMISYKLFSFSAKPEKKKWSPMSWSKDKAEKKEEKEKEKKEEKKG